MSKMNTLDKQIQGVIQNSISRTMKIKIPLQNNEEERNILLQILKEQAELKQKMAMLRLSIENLRSDIAVIKHHHEYNC